MKGREAEICAGDREGMRKHFQIPGGIGSEGWEDMPGWEHMPATVTFFVRQRGNTYTHVHKTRMFKIAYSMSYNYKGVVGIPPVLRHPSP